MVIIDLIEMIFRNKIFQSKCPMTDMDLSEAHEEPS